jgi:hypothetical protein
MQTNRIPDFTPKTRAGMSVWFDQMSRSDLLFHPDDSPQDIVTIADNKPMFTAAECARLQAITREMFELFGDDVYEAAYPFFMISLEKLRQA